MRFPSLRRNTGVVAAAAVLAVTALASTGTAHAYYPAQPYVDHINGERAWIFWNDGNLFTNGYANELAGPDGIPGPDGTPDGRGGFAYYTGNWGTGAIYAHYMGYWAGQNQYRARAIYGDILTSWASFGHENGKGYPLDREYTAGSPHVCPAGNRTQTFTPLSSGGTWTACWNPANRVVTWVYAPPIFVQ